MLASSMLLRYDWMPSRYVLWVSYDAGSEVKAFIEVEDMMGKASLRY